MDTNTLKKLREELRENIDSKVNDQLFFKEKVKSYGVRTPVVRKLAKKHFKDIKHLDKKEVFTLCEELLRSGYNEEATVAIAWANEFVDSFEKSDFEVFETWLERYIDNWGKDDDFCLHITYPMIERYPHLIPGVKQWAHLPNIWMRRASAVSFITTHKGFYATKGHLEDIFAVAEILLHDPEDLVQKGYGWMLKAASIQNQKEVFDFVMQHKSTMPRTALRYAIEKMPENLRKQAMKK